MCLRKERDAPVGSIDRYTAWSLLNKTHLLTNTPIGWLFIFISEIYVKRSFICLTGIPFALLVCTVQWEEETHRRGRLLPRLHKAENCKTEGHETEEGQESPYKAARE